MKGNNTALLIISFFLMSLLFTDVAFANQASVTIEAPESAVKGSEITIKVTAIHNANNIFHHIEWLSVMISGKEIARWDYTFRNLPDGEKFTKEIKYTVNDLFVIKAEASCNWHGSKGPSTAQVSIK